MVVLRKNKFDERLYRSHPLICKAGVTAQLDASAWVTNTNATLSLSCCWANDLSLAYGDYTRAEAGKTLKIHVAHLPERAESFRRAL